MSAARTALLTLAGIEDDCREASYRGHTTKLKSLRSHLAAMRKMALLHPGVVQIGDTLFAVTGGENGGDGHYRWVVSDCKELHVIAVQSAPAVRHYIVEWQGKRLFGGYDEKGFAACIEQFEAKKKELR